MTAHPLVSCCWAIVAYLDVSFCAFWMSVSTPCALNAFSSCGTVAVLPAARRRCVGQDDASALAGGRSACSAARLPCWSCGVAVTSGERCYGKARR